MSKSANNIQRKEFDEFIRAMGLEIEQAQVKLISAANSQMLLHYWKMGNFILYYQKQLGWGAKVVQQISKALHSIFPDKKGYSPRNLQYMCQFARLYPIEILESLLQADKKLELPTIDKVLSTAKGLNEFESEQKPLTEVQSTEYKEETITQQVVAQIEQLFLSSCVSRINWAGHVILMNHSLPLGIRYWYMQEAVQYGWSRIIANSLNEKILTRLHSLLNKNVQIYEARKNNKTRLRPRICFI